MIERPYSIYKITCLETGKCYIGQTCRRVQDRWSAHKSSARRGSNRCEALVRAINKYGEDFFTVEVLAVAVNSDEASAIERGLISQYGTLVPRGYNLTSGGEGGRRFSIETRLKMAEAARGKTRAPFSDETKRRMSIARKRIMTAEFRAHIGSFHKGKTVTPETVAKGQATKAANRAARQSMG